MHGVYLMAFSNREGSLLLGTSNKSELAVGYSTLYGDMIGALMPIGDLLKSEVFKLSNYYNSQSEIIPKGIIDRPPSAELRPNQKDSDSLPEYDQLDPIVHKLVEGLSAPSSLKTPCARHDDDEERIQALAVPDLESERSRLRARTPLSGRTEQKL